MDPAAINNEVGVADGRADRLLTVSLRSSGFRTLLAVRRGTSLPLADPVALTPSALDRRRLGDSEVDDLIRFATEQPDDAFIALRPSRIVAGDDSIWGRRGWPFEP